uniref:glutathione transferase n=1 Tax=Rattus norvegicus TaxID=10116 RepID=A0A8L2UQ98_RAT
QPAKSFTHSRRIPQRSASKIPSSSNCESWELSGPVSCKRALWVRSRKAELGHFRVRVRLRSWTGFLARLLPGQITSVRLSARAPQPCFLIQSPQKRPPLQDHRVSAVQKGERVRLGQLRLGWTPIVESRTLPTVVERNPSTPPCVTTYHHGFGALPGPAVAAQPRGLHLRQEEWHPLSVAYRGFTQSTAILIYLSSKYQVADHWYPADLQARAQVHEYLGWHADNIRGTFGVLLWTKVLGPLIGVQVPEEKVERNRNSMVLALQRLEDKFLRDRAFIAGQQVTLADLMSLEELIQPVALGCNLFEGRPQLTAWRERVEAFLGAELCQEAHNPIMSVLGQAAKKTLPVPPPEAHASMMLRIARIP